jgi:hypothetical protein
MGLGFRTFYHPDRLNYPLKRAGEKGENKWQLITPFPGETRTSIEWANI